MACDEKGVGQAFGGMEPEPLPAEVDVEPRRRWEMPDAYLLLFGIIVLAGFSTWVVPVGSFSLRTETVMVDGGAVEREVLDPESFAYERNEAGELQYRNISLFTGEAYGGKAVIHRFPSDARGETGLFNYAFEGLVSGSKYGAAVGVVAFILVIGGAFGMILRTGAIETGILLVITRMRSMAFLILPVLFCLFSLGGAIFGMGEEAIAFAMIVCPLMVALGYDSITGLLVTYVATQIGFATSWMNPFSVAIAQGIAEVPVLSGSGFRITMWLVFTVLGLGFTAWYARRVRLAPERSLAYATDAFFREDLEANRELSVRFGWGHGLVLLTVGLGLAWVIYGVLRYQYYIPEIATQFFVIGIVSGAIGVAFKLNGMRLNDMAGSFRKGASELLGAAMIVGMAKGILILLGGDDPTEPTVLNTLLFQASQVIGDLAPAVSALGMYGFQSVFNFFVSSGSGQAALTMPLMAPLADLVGVSRQVSVLAFQLGDGLTNLIIPTSASLMGCLGVARLDWIQWVRAILGFQIVLMGLAVCFVLLGVWVGL